MGQGFRHRWKKGSLEREGSRGRTLIKEVGLAKGQIGKIDVRDAFSLVEVAGVFLSRPRGG